MTPPTLPHPLGLIAVFAFGFVVASADEAPRRRVYADYHSARYTREHDGALGLWKFSTVGRTSRVPNPVVNRNADLVDENGRHELASADYPLVGMQSELDPDYLEYQILSAKLAHIDGFFVEWGFVEHASERIRQALTVVAARYDFEIGITLCDRWLFTQLPSRRPQLRSREQLVDAFIANYQALLRILHAAPTTVRHQGQPVVLLFGDGLSPEEFDRVTRAAESTEGGGPCVLIRPKLAASVNASGKLDPSWDAAPWFEPARGFRPGVEGFFGWIPTRARTGGSGELLRQFDRYGTVADSLDYLKLITAVSGSGPRVSSAAPGFDNRNCAGWGSDFSLLERGDGELYRAMWEFNVANQGRIDWVFLPTWNDWTEGSQIEPSVEDQGLFLRLTAAAAARFKGVEADLRLTDLPLRLFRMRQRVHRLQHIGLDTAHLPIETLDRAGSALAKRDRAAARQNLDKAETTIIDAEKRLPAPERLVFSNDDGRLAPSLSETPAAPARTLPLRLRLDETAAAKLRTSDYDAVLEFEYRPVARGKLEIVTDASRPRSAVGDFGVVADLNLLGPGEWRTARVRLFARNCAWQHRLAGDNDLEFRGAAEVRNVRLTCSIPSTAPSALLHRPPPSQRSGRRENDPLPTLSDR